jgi:hypothetical protein
MWRTVADWILRTVELVEGQRKQQAKIVEFEKRIRDLEEAFRILSQETRHAREMEASERTNLLLRLENAVQTARLALPEGTLPSGKERR